MEYKTMLLFLLFTVGINQLLFNSSISIGQYNIFTILDLSPVAVCTAIGQNMRFQSIMFLDFIITKYFLFSILNLLRLPALLLAAVHYPFIKDSVKKALLLKPPTYPYVTNIAYSTHMLYIGALFCIVSPLSSVIVLIVYILYVAVERYNILYVYDICTGSDITPDSGLLKNIVDNIFYAMVLVYVPTISYYVVLSQKQTDVYALLLHLIMDKNASDGLVVILAAAVLLVCFFMSAFYKSRLYRMYGHSLVSVCESQHHLLKDCHDSDHIPISHLSRISHLYPKYAVVLTDSKPQSATKLTPMEAAYVAKLYTTPAILLCSYLSGSGSIDDIT